MNSGKASVFLEDQSVPLQTFHPRKFKVCHEIYDVLLDKCFPLLHKAPATVI